MKTLAITVLAATFGFGFSANADLVVGGTIELTLESKTPYTLVDVQLGSTNYDDSKAPMYNWTNGITSFCAEFTDSIYVGQTIMYNVVEVRDIPRNSGDLGSGRATLINDLYSRWYDFYESDGWDNRRAAAFQIVLWEIRHETSDGDTAAEILDDLSIDHGYAEFDSTYWVNLTAKYLLDDLGGGTDSFLTYDSLVGLTSDSAQDHITMGSTEPVPGPFGLACGLGIMGLRRRRSRRA